MSEDYAATLRRLQREFQTADRLALTLATTASQGRDLERAHRTLDHRERMMISYAISSATRFTSTWVNLCAAEDCARMGRSAVADALAGHDLRYELPEVAVSLRTPWEEAMEVRAQLRRLGAAAEDTAVRLAPSWRLPLEELPAIATAVARAPTD